MPEDPASRSEALLRRGVPLAGRYRLLELLGRGGMGSVFRARDETSGRELALKLLRRESDVARARFQREAETTAQLRHPNVIRIHDAGQAEGHDFLAYELIEGGRPLDEAWRELDLSARLELLDGVAAGVEAAHQLGVVHRDLKPENVIVRPDGHPVVLDFGLAHVEESDLTRTGQVLGTPSHMAPEQFGGKGATAASDVWALGVLLYEALYARNPFVADASTLVQVMAKINAAAPPFPAGPPPALIALVRRTLVTEPSQRLPDAAAFRAALREARAAQADVRARPALAVAGVAFLVSLSVLGWGIAGERSSAAERALATPAPTPDPDPTQELLAPASPPPPRAAFAPRRPVEVWHDLDRVRKLAFSRQTLVVLSPGHVRCYALGPKPRLLSDRRPGYLDTLPTPRGLLLCSPRRTALLDPETLELERISDDMALAHDPEREETLFRTAEGVELRGPVGQVLQRCELPASNRVETSSLLPERILLSLRQKLDEPLGLPGQLYLLARSGPAKLTGHPRFVGIGMNRLARVAGSLVFSPGNGVLIQIDEELSAPRTFSSVESSSALRVNAHRGYVREIHPLGKRLLTWSWPMYAGNPKGGALSEIALWDLPTRKPLWSLRDVQLMAVAVHPSGLLAFALPHRIVLVHVDAIETLQRYVPPPERRR